MDRDRFDALTRLLATKGSRRVALGALISGALLGHELEDADAKKKGKGKGGGKKRGGGGGNGDGGGGKDRKGGPAKGNAKSKGKKRKRTRAEAAPPGCFSGSPCPVGRLKNAFNCDFENSTAFTPNKDLYRFNCRACNLRGVNMTGANLMDANLSGACLVDANLTGANLTRTNLGGATLCRTVMPDGSINNSGCNNGSSCCQTCISPGGTGCNIGGGCCGNLVCTGTGAGTCACPTGTNLCSDGVCRQCCINGQVNGQCPGTAMAPNVCCNNTCVSGNCCDVSNCPPPSAQCIQAVCPANRICTTNPLTGGSCTLPSGGPGTCSNGTCVQCTADSQCSGGGQCVAPVCNMGTCGLAPRSTTTPCTLPAGGPGFCNGTGTCVQCNTTAQCGNPGACKTVVCNPGTNTCDITNITGPHATCPGGTCCNGTCFPQSNCCVGPNQGGVQCGGQCVVGICCALSNTCSNVGQCCPHPSQPNRLCCRTPASGGPPRCCLRSATIGELFDQTICGTGSHCCSGVCIANICVGDPGTC